MTISLQSRFWRVLLRMIFKSRLLTLEENRAQSANTNRLMGRIPAGIEVQKIAIEAIPAAWIRPAHAAQDKVILHLHGGGYVLGGIASHQMMCALMAQTLKANVILPEYRLAPEHPFPAALEDTLKVYRWLLDQGHRPENIVLSGDSAGGGLSLATALSLRDAGEPLPAAVVCLSPWADLTHSGQSHRTQAAADVVLTTDTLKAWALCYTDASNLSNPLVSPVFADLHGFPPLLIQVGSHEVLLDDSLALANHAKTAGVHVTLRVWEGLWHVWPALAELIPESRSAFEEMDTFIRSVIK